MASYIVAVPINDWQIAVDHRYQRRYLSPPPLCFSVSPAPRFRSLPQDCRALIATLLVALWPVSLMQP
jgi:hypothetical protein